MRKQTIQHLWFSTLNKSKEENCKVPLWHCANHSSHYLTKGMADLEKHRESDKKEQSHWTIEKHQESCSKLQDQKQSQVLCHHDLDMTHSLWCHDSHKIEWLKITLLWSVYLNSEFIAIMWWKAASKADLQYGSSDYITTTLCIQQINGSWKGLWR